MTYIAAAHDSMGTLGSARSDSFGDALMGLRDLIAEHGSRRYVMFTLYNDDTFDYATDTGYDDGLTEDERDAVLHTMEAHR